MRPNRRSPLAQIQAAHAAGLPRRVVLMDAGYGADTALRDGITALGLPYKRRYSVHDDGLAAGSGARCPLSRGTAGAGHPPACAGMPSIIPSP